MLEIAGMIVFMGIMWLILDYVLPSALTNTEGIAFVAAGVVVGLLSGR